MDQISEEFFDIVNARDEVVGRASRREVHARGLWHRAIHVLVFDRRGRVFLQKRSMLKDMAPGCWDSSCSGHVDSGEDYDQAAVRELWEEIGLRVEAAPERWFRIEARDETGWEFVWVYRLRHEGPFVLAPAEIERGEWFEPAEVSRRIADRPAEFAVSFRYIWAEMPSRGGTEG
ncbi:MAG TPA: NUDIX domain-containing protein [Opitutaceae bacterium]|nr:NUDIX domain-containing protein [Opitutaceae bacterium]